MGALLLILIVVAGVAGLVAVALRWDRYVPGPASGPMLPTTEVHIDPETGRRQRVHLNPSTGARLFVDEPELPAGAPAPPLERPGLLGLGVRRRPRALPAPADEAAPAEPAGGPEVPPPPG